MLTPPPRSQSISISHIVTDNRRSRLDSPFCVITQHRKFEFGHYRQSKKISYAQELTMQLSQTLSSAIAQIKVSNSPITNHTKKILPQRPPPFCLACGKHNIYWFSFVSGFGFYRRQTSKRSTSDYRTFRALVEFSFVLLN